MHHKAKELPYKRVETIGDATLYLGDCLDILPTLGKVDAVITDPPFNAGKNFKNDSLDVDGWWYFCESLAVTMKYIQPENMLIEVGKNDKYMRTAFDLHHKYRWIITLNYTNAMRQGVVGFSNTGIVLWYGEGKCYKRYMDRIDAPLTSTIDEFQHPSPKEIKHYTRLVEMFSAKDQIICDPFMGSGTTGIAAVQLNRKFIGIEDDENHFLTSCERIDQAQRQGKLF